MKVSVGGTPSQYSRDGGDGDAGGVEMGIIASILLAAYESVVGNLGGLRR